MNRQSIWLWVRLSGVAGMALVFVTTLESVPTWLRGIAGVIGVALLVLCLSLVRRGQARMRSPVAGTDEAG